jgi:hypothetical protein
MECGEIVFSGHAVRRMFERQITEGNVRAVVETGDAIAEYPADKPYPSRLLLGYVGGLPLHVVVAEDEVRARCFVVTVYVPEPTKWHSNFRTRKRRWPV